MTICLTPPFRIAPASKMDFDLAGRDNEFSDFQTAYEAACAMDASSPLGATDEWIVYESNGAGGYRRV